MAVALSLVVLACCVEANAAIAQAERTEPTSSATQGAPDDASTTSDGIFENRVVVAITAAAVGILLTSIVNLILQFVADRRRFMHERKTQQQEQWDQEAKVQKERWERENELRNYDERRRAYIGMLQATVEYGLVGAEASLTLDDARKFADEAAGLKAELKTLAPDDVSGVGDLLVGAYSECMLAYATNDPKAEEKLEQLRKRSRQFAALAQVNLGLIDKGDKRALDVYRELLAEAQSDRR